MTSGIINVGTRATIPPIAHKTPTKTIIKGKSTNVTIVAEPKKSLTPSNSFTEAANLLGELPNLLTSWETNFLNSLSAKSSSKDYPTSIK